MWLKPFKSRLIANIGLLEEGSKVKSKKLYYIVSESHGREIFYGSFCLKLFETSTKQEVRSQSSELKIIVYPTFCLMFLVCPAPPKRVVEASG